MATPLLGQFLIAINGFIKAGNAEQIASYLAIEPPFSQHYNGMIQELRSSYPSGQEEELEARCQKALTAAADGWSNFIRFMVQYFVHIRDVSQDTSQYLATYEQLLELQAKANSALSQGSLGALLLQTVITNARLLCRLAIGLDRQPDLIAHLRSAGPQGDEGQRETLPERAANTVRVAFVTCLNERAEMSDGKPKGKQHGIYKLANLCLKILFQCRKTRNATQIFENISNSAPPVAVYPRSQRVTYLYYLGRYLFQNNHLYRAQLVLQTAYNESPAHPGCIKQRRLILVYLVTSNVILGRFPSNALMQAPEAQGFREHFIPLQQAIRSGNLQAFDQFFAEDGPHIDWLWHYRVFLQLRNRCEVLVWRSLSRKVFQLYGTRPELGSKNAATLDLDALMDAFTSLMPSPDVDTYVDPDLDGEEYISDDYQFFDEVAVESRLSSLIEQGLVSGYISHERQKLAILGASKTGGDPVKAGFPPPWEVIERRSSDDVPGWKKDSAMKATNPYAAAGPGTVFNLSGVRSVGDLG